MLHNFSKVILFLFSFSLLFNNCKKDPEVVVHIDKDEFTVKDQNNIGLNLAALIANTTGQYTKLDRSENTPIYNYLDQLWSSVINTDLVENRLTFDWEITILKDDENRSVFSLPGGKIFIYTGLLKAINSENELFGILAHELYYIDKGTLIEAMKAEYGSLVVGDLVIGQNSTGAIDIAETIYRMSIAPAKVIEADNFAIDIVCPFQYEARGLKSFIEMAESSEQEIQWLTTRPGQAGRLDRIEALATDCGVEESTFTERYSTYKAMLP